MQLTPDSKFCGFCSEVRFRGMGVCPFHGAEARTWTVIAARAEEPRSLRQYQDAVAAWQRQRFPEESQDDCIPPLLGLMEELGELARAVLKQRQNIRMTREEWEAKGQDAVGDILIFLLGFCNRRGWNLEEILRQTWAEVRKREYPKVEEL